MPDKIVCDCHLCIFNLGTGTCAADMLNVVAGRCSARADYKCHMKHPIAEITPSMKKLYSYKFNTNMAIWRFGESWGNVLRSLKNNMERPDA